MFSPLHSITKEEQYEKHLCKIQSLWEIQMIPIIDVTATLHSHKVLPQIDTLVLLAKRYIDTWDTKEDKGKSRLWA